MRKLAWRVWTNVSLLWSLQETLYSQAGISLFRMTKFRVGF